MNEIGAVVMDEIVKKASVLLEALPYIREFHGKIFVIKYGGSALEDENLRRSVLQDLSFMHYVGIKPVLIHGGGPSISKALEERGISTKFIKGIRKTDKFVLEVVVQQLRSLNEKIVEQLKELSCPSASVGLDEPVIKARQMKEELGFVGEVVGVNAGDIFRFLQENVIPVVVPLGVDYKGQLYNLNADVSAGEIAVSLGAEKLVFLTNVDGIMYNNSLLSSVSAEEIENLILDDVIGGGMLPKVKSGIWALERGVRKVHIVNAKQKHALLLEIFTKKGIGTEILIKR